ncbi:MAG: hypothetical protein HY040_13430 [Planctomycetes bacterium]|nr:hypothetical protein [Planctomycetota bacterium]
MARLLLLSLLTFSLLLVEFAAGGDSPSEGDGGVRSSLALQQAMAVARDHLRAGDSQKAVTTLESELAKVNGHAGYLRLLRDAYRAHIKELWLANRGQDARRYIERLSILEPGAAQDPSLRPAEVLENKTAVPTSPATTPQATAFPDYAKNHPRPSAGVPNAAMPNAARGKVEDAFGKDDPFALVNQRLVPKDAENSKLVLTLLRKADDEFQQKHFSKARLLYEDAYKADRESLAKCKDRWAYCLLDHVVEQLNQPALSHDTLMGLEQQVKGALTMAPGLEKTGRWLLGEIDQRQKARTSAAIDPAPTVVVQVNHLGRNPQGWQVAETSHFLIFHNQAKEVIEKVARVAESTRVEMSRKWFNTEGETWTPKCELILHATVADYTRATGVAGTSPGHTRIESDPSGQRVVGRRMDLRCDNPSMVEAVLPHETTHVVLAGQFGRHQVPRWADEGIAVLSEPRDKIDQHRRNLNKVMAERALFGLKELMEMNDYPQSARIQAFYAQAVCLADFLSKERGPFVFTSFVRDGLREGYDTSLRRHYQSDFNALEQRWQQYLGSR